MTDNSVVTPDAASDSDLAAAEPPTDASAASVEPPAAVASCTWCGAQAAGPPPTWSLQTSDRGRGVEWLCEPCTRTNVRSIEGKLDVDWW